MGGLNRKIDWDRVVGGSGETETATIEFESALGVTGKALLVNVDGDDEFIPFKEIHEADEDEQTLEVSVWLCRKRGWV